MTPLMTNVLNSTAHTLEATALIVATVAAFAVRIKIPGANKPTGGPVDGHTMADIGFEPGSITWMR